MRRDVGMLSDLLRLWPDLERDPEHAFAQLSIRHKALLLRILYERVELEGTGHGNGRRLKVVSCVPRSPRAV